MGRSTEFFFAFTLKIQHMFIISNSQDCILSGDEPHLEALPDNSGHKWQGYHRPDAGDA